MIEYIVIVLIVYIALQDFLNRKERNRLVNAFLAKNLTELNNVETKPSKPTPDAPPEFVPISDMDNEDFDKAIKKQLGRESRTDKIKEGLKKVIHGR